jgi:hypothetical protein
VRDIGHIYGVIPSHNSEIMRIIWKLSDKNRRGKNFKHDAREKENDWTILHLS